MSKPIRGERGLRKPITPWVAELAVIVTLSLLFTGGAWNLWAHLNRIIFDVDRDGNLVHRDPAGELGICEDDAAEFNPGVADLMSRAPVWSDLGPDIHGYRTLWIRTLTLAVILLSGTAVFLAGFLIGRLT